MVYENDQKHFFEKRNMSMTRQIGEDENVSKALEEFEKSKLITLIHRYEHTFSKQTT